jgi:hypothetical protein
MKVFFKIQGPNYKSMKELNYHLILGGECK